MYQILCFVYSLESFRRDNSNEYPQHRFCKRTEGFLKPSLSFIWSSAVNQSIPDLRPLDWHLLSHMLFLKCDLSVGQDLSSETTICKQLALSQACHGQRSLVTTQPISYLHQTSSQTNPVFYVSTTYKSFENTLGKGEIACYEG